MTFQRLATGQRGEELAARFLQKKKYRIIGRNIRLKTGEIDIIAQDQGTLVFVEVKTRTSNAFGSPLDAVDRRKMGQISRAAQEYILRHNIHDQAMRFDVIGITLTPQPSIDHIENAFELG